MSLRPVVILGFAGQPSIAGSVLMRLVKKRTLIDSRPCPENHKLRVSKEIEEKSIHLRTTYHFGPDVIV